jgi:hypothetical protein
MRVLMNMLLPSNRYTTCRAVNVPRARAQQQGEAEQYVHAPPLYTTHSSQWQLEPYVKT